MAMSAGAAGLMAGGSILSSALGMAAANHGAFKQYKYNSKLQKQAAALNYKYAAKSAKNQPTWNRTGLEAAGYNPMLAVQNSTAGANSSWTSNSQVNQPDYAGLGVGNLYSNALDTQRLKNETLQTDSTVQSNEANARHLNAQAANEEVRNPYISREIEAQLGKTFSETAKLNSDRDYNYAAIENMQSRIELEQFLGELDYRARLYGADRGAAATMYSANKSYEGHVYNSKTLKEITDAHSPSGRSESFKNYASGIGSVLGGAGSIISPFRGLFDNPFDIDEHTYTYDRNGNRSGERHTQRYYRR